VGTGRLASVAGGTDSRRRFLCLGMEAAEARAGRYPTLTGGEPWLYQVQEVLLSSEPYRFKSEHLLAAQALCPQARVRLVDGELLSWYGPRAAAGLRYLRDLAGSDG
jgi:hypothetical protein